MDSNISVKKGYQMHSIQVNGRKGIVTLIKADSDQQTTYRAYGVYNYDLDELTVARDSSGSGS